MYIFILLVKGNKYYYSERGWQGLKDNATLLTYEQCNALKVRFQSDTYFIKV